MYGIFIYIGSIFIVHVGKYIILDPMGMYMYKYYIPTFAGISLTIVQTNNSHHMMKSLPLTNHPYIMI